MKIIDITHTLSNETPVYPGDYDTSITKRKSLETDGFNSYLLQSCLHTGTHIDMPMHFTNDYRFASDFPAGTFIGSGLLIDARGEKKIGMKPGYESMVKTDDIVIIYTGFCERYREREYFTGYPAVTDELRDFFITKKIKILGTDTPSPDYFPFETHKELLGNGIFILENLANLAELSEYKDFEVIALPLKIAAEGSFVRAVCKII